MAVELAAAYISLLPETSKIAPGVRKALGGVEKTAEKSGKKSGGLMSGALGKALKVGAAGAAAASIGALGTSMVKGFQRLSALDQATAKLSGLGHSAKTVESIMTNALASVKGTAFGMDEAATTAAGAVAAGVKPGRDLERTLKLVADAATIGGTSMSEMGAIFNKVGTSNKIQGEVIAQLGERGIPIIQLLSKELGKSAEETVKLASQGKINFATFQKAIESGMGGAALKSGETFQGALKNAWAAVGRIGANLLGGVFPQLTGGLGTITSWLGKLEAAAKPVGEALGNALAGAAEAAGVFFDALRGQSELNEFDGILKTLNNAGVMLSETFGGMGDKVGPAFAQLVANLSPLGVIIAGLAPALPGLVDGFVAVGETVRSSLVPAITSAASTILPALLTAVVALLPPIIDLALRVLPPLVDMFSAVVPIVSELAAVVLPPLALVLSRVAGLVGDNVDILGPLAVAVFGGVAAFKAFSAVSATVRAVQAGYAAATYGAVGATYALGTAQKIGAFAQQVYATATTKGGLAAKAAAAGQWVLNAALSANPIGIVVVAVAALVGAIIYLWNTNEDFRNFIIAAWDKIKGAFMAVVNWVRDVLVPGFKEFFGKIGEHISAFVEVNKQAWALIVGAFQGAWSWVSGVFAGLWAGIVDIFGGPFNTVRKIVEVFVGLTIYIIRSIWDWLKGTFQALWAGSVAIFSGPIQKVLDFIGRFVEANKRLFRAVWDWVRGVFATWWAGVQTVFVRPFNLAKDAISRTLTAVRGVINTVWTWASGTFKRNWDRFKSVLVAPINLAKDGISNALDKIKRVFDLTKDSIGKAWDKIKSVMSAPVKWVAVNVVNPLIRAFNKIAGAVGMSQNKLSEWSFPGFADGGWTGPGSRLQPAGLVHADEFVINKAARGRFEQRFPGYLHHINSTGTLPGYAKGGRVFQPVPGRANRHGTGYPWATFAGDFPVGMGTPIKAWKDGIIAAVRYLTTSYGKHVRINHDDGTSSLYAHMSRIIANQVGQRVLGGQTIGLVGSTGNSTGPHLHFETMGGPYRGGKSGGLSDLFSGFASPLAWLKDLIAAPLRKLGGQGGGLWGDIVGGLPKLLRDGMLDKVSLFDDGGWLQPGQLAYNGLRRPEPVFTPGQWDKINSGGDVEVRVFIGDRELTDIVDVQIDHRVGEARSAARRTMRSGVTV